MTSSPPKRFVVYADFNCPFCYALDLRLADLAKNETVDWRPVEHAPDAGGMACTVDELADVAAEVYTVRHRAPEIPIRLPSVRPVTRLANLAWASTARSNPDAAPRLRTGLYRALWLDGLDLGDPSVIRAVFEAQGLVAPDPDPGDVELLAQWQEEWAAGPFDHRIPSMVGQSGELLLGLSAPSDIRGFLNGERRVLRSSGICSFVPRPVVVIVGDPRPLWPVLKRLGDGVQLLLAPDTAAADELIATAAADLALMIWDGEPVPLPRLTSPVLSADPTGDCAVLVLDLAFTSQRAWEAVRTGATDCLDALAPPELTERRLRERLATRRKLEQLRGRERLDALTRVPGRAELQRLLEQEWHRGLRSKMPLSLLLIDVDDFGQINKEEGHLHGDACLQGLASALSASVLRPGDVVCRFGGDEFVILLPDTGVESAHRVVDRCQAAVRGWSQGFAEATGSQGPTVSIGATSERPLPDRDPQMLLAAADRALLRAKRLGRDRSEFELG